MNIVTSIEVRDWGDYDISRTVCVMVADFKCDVKALVDEYCTRRKLPGTSGLSEKQLDGRTDDFIQYLIRYGFKPLKMTEVIFSD